MAEKIRLEADGGKSTAIPKADRILTVMGTRPEIIKVIPVIRAFADCAGVTSLACHTGQHADMGRDLLAAAAIEPCETLVRPDGPGLDGLFAGLLASIGGAIARQKPDAIVVQGDTASAAAGALAGYHAGVPVAHVEAGLRSGDISQPWPEEGYRRFIAPLARWHFAPTRAAADALLRENISADAVHITGNTVIDTLHWAEALIGQGRAPGRDPDCGGRPLVLATVHRREHSPEQLNAIARALRAIVDEHAVSLLLPAHPRAESRALTAPLRDHPHVRIVEPLPYFDFVRAMRASRLIVSDSGGVQEEATAMGRPVLVLRNVTERAEAVDTGSARLVGSEPDAICAAARDALSRAMPSPDGAFGDGRAADRIAAIVAGRDRSERTAIAA